MFAAVVAVATAVAVAYHARHASARATAKLTSLTCQWKHSRMYATAVVHNTSNRQGFFDLRVNYTLARHGEQPMMTVLAPVDPRSAKSFSWADTSPHSGEPITSCRGSVQPEPDGSD